MFTGTEGKELFNKDVSSVFYLQSLIIQTYRNTQTKAGSIALHRKYFSLK